MSGPMLLLVPLLVQGPQAYAPTKLDGVGNIVLSPKQHRTIGDGLPLSFVAYGPAGTGVLYAYIDAPQVTPAFSAFGLDINLGTALVVATGPSPLFFTLTPPVGTAPGDIVLQVIGPDPTVPPGPPYQGWGASNPVFIEIRPADPPFTLFFPAVPTTPQTTNPVGIGGGAAVGDVLVDLTTGANWTSIINDVVAPNYAGSPGAFTELLANVGGGNLIAVPPVWASYPPPPAIEARLADLDKDGDLDLVLFPYTFNTALGQTVVFRNDTAAQMLVAVSQLPINADIRGAALADIDGDSWIDIIELVQNENAPGTGNRLRIWQNTYFIAPWTWQDRSATGAVPWVPNLPAPPGIAAPLGLDVMDINCDAFIDVVVGASAATIHEYVQPAGGVGAGGVLLYQPQPLPAGSLVRRPIVSSFDPIAGLAPSMLHQGWVPGNGSAINLRTRACGGPPPTWSIPPVWNLSHCNNSGERHEVGNLDSDGLLDFAWWGGAACNPGFPVPPCNFSTTVWINNGGAAAGFTAMACLVNPWGQPNIEGRWPVICDINNDGLNRADVVFTTMTNSAPPAANPTHSVWIQ